jgi:hypothetical protein
MHHAVTGLFESVPVSFAIAPDEKNGRVGLHGRINILMISYLLRLAFRWIIDPGLVQPAFGFSPEKVWGNQKSGLDPRISEVSVGTGDVWLPHSGHHGGVALNHAYTEAAVGTHHLLRSKHVFLSFCPFPSLRCAPQIESVVSS